MSEREEVTLDEFETQAAANAADEGEQQEQEQQRPDLSTITLDGDDVPDFIRGKSAAEAIRALQATQNALRISEEERQRERESYRPQQQQQQYQQHAPAGYNREEMAQLLETDPIAAYERMAQHVAGAVEQSLANRTQPLAAGIAAQAEQRARQQHPEVFELFGDQINRVVASLPDKAALASPDAWKDIVSYVSGQPENLDKLIERRLQKQRESEAPAARQQEREASGYSGRSQPSGIRSDSRDTELDPATTKIAQQFIDAGLFKNIAEYKKWMKA